MATVSNTVMQVDTTVPAGQRYIYLTQDDFNGGAGEGNFINGSGPDTIPVYDTLKRGASRVEIYLREGSGGAGDEYAIQIRVNPTTQVFLRTHTREHSPIPFPVDQLDVSRNVANTAPAQEIIAREGETVTWSNDYPSINNIEITGVAAVAGAIGEFNILIK